MINLSSPYICWFILKRYEVKTVLDVEEISKLKINALLEITGVINVHNTGKIINRNSAEYSCLHINKSDTLPVGNNRYGIYKEHKFAYIFNNYFRFETPKVENDICQTYQIIHNDGSDY